MDQTRIMKALYAALIGIVALLIIVPLAAAGDRAFPSWDKQINAPNRFKVLGDFAGAAVLDRETGLVWEQSPSTSLFSWLNAQLHCTLATGGRLGWRLPTLQELASLVDPNNPGGNPDLPPGHPFSNVQSSDYWSASTGAGSSSLAWVVLLGSGVVNDDNKSSTLYVWCVRGGQGVDPQ